MIVPDRLSKQFLSVTMVFALFTGCEEEPENAMNPVSHALEIPQSTRLTSPFPQPTGDPSAPALEEERDTLYLIADTHTNIFVSLADGDPVGFNVQVKGASEYFNVTSKNAFLDLQSTALGFAITVKENTAPASFSILYNVYDANGRVSNTIERTVIISGLPGKNSEFLSGKMWSMVKEIWGSAPATETKVMGEPSIVEFTLPGNCGGQPGPVKAFQITRIDYEYYTFSSNGSFDMEVKNYNQLLNGLSEDGCSPKYAIIDEIGHYHGVWSYHSDTRTLILRYKKENIANELEQQFRVSIKDGILTLVMLHYSVPATFVLQ
jgi:hypothetical protein